MDVKEENYTWKQRLWFQIINNCEATGIKYDMMISPKNRKPLQEIMAKGHGIDGRLFKTQFPFSWLLFELIENIVSSEVNHQGTYFISFHTFYWVGNLY